MSASCSTQRDEAEVRAAVEEVLARDEFHRTPTLLERCMEWLKELFAPDTDGPLVAAEIAAWVVGALFLVLLVSLVSQLLRTSLRKRGELEEAERARGFDALARAARLRHESRAARAAGDLRLALRLSFWALVVGLGARGDLTYRDAWTNRELLRRGRPPHALLELLEPLVNEVEAKDFGRVATTEADIDRLEALCAQHLGSLPPDGTEAAA